MLIFEHSRPGRSNDAQIPDVDTTISDIPASLMRDSAPGLPEVSEMQAVRHYTRLSQKNFSIDTQFYPLGSCTMKYNPRGCNTLALLPGFAQRHPLSPDNLSQGFRPADPASFAQDAGSGAARAPSGGGCQLSRD